MGGHYFEHQGRVNVGATLTSNMLLHAKMRLHYTISEQTKKHHRQCTKRSMSRRLR